jgi:hypothetical protein
MENLESAMSKIFSSHAERGGYFFDEEIERITDLLVKMDRKAWSIRPRTYAVLRMMDNVAELMDKFVEENFFDINFPYTPITLPLIVKGATERHKFIKKQAFILTDAKSMENGSHSHLGNCCYLNFR